MRREDAEREFRDERDRLLKAYHAVEDPTSLFDFQQRLARTIESRETAAFTSKNLEAKQHLRLLRLLGDGLAWQLLHPFVIRQLAKNPGPPPGLGSQGDGFRHTLEVARTAASAEHLVLVSDLTHCLRVGDVIVCDDPERPVIIECAGNERLPPRGRKARQMERARAIAHLLNDGRAILPGDTREHLTLEISTPPVHTWSVVDRVVLAARRAGSAADFVTEADMVFAMRSAADMDIGKLRDLASGMTMPVAAVYTRVTERPHPRMPPCVAWDVSNKTKRLVYQGDVFVGHVVDATDFIGRRSVTAEVAELLRSGREITGFGVQVGDVSVSASDAFLMDVLLGFQTIESSAAAILETAERFTEVGDHPLDSKV